MNWKSVKAFTILELIIVVIIVGVLASLAMPRFFMMVERSRSVEAIGLLSMMRKDVETCLAATVSGNCITSFTARWQEYTNGPNSHFELGVSSMNLATTPPSFLVSVNRRNYELPGPDPGGATMCGLSVVASVYSTIALCRTTTDVQIVGTGFYEGLAF